MSQVTEVSCDIYGEKIRKLTLEEWEKYRRSYTLMFDLSGFDKAEEYEEDDDEDDDEDNRKEDENEDENEEDYPRIDLDVCSVCEPKVREAFDGVIKKLTTKKKRGAQEGCVRHSR